MATMKAIRLTKPTPDAEPTVTYTDVPIPALEPGHVLVQIAASLYNPSDRLNANGGFPDTTFPRTPGRDFAGTIVAPPARAGEHVFATGGGLLGMTHDGPHAQYALVPAPLAVARPSTLTVLDAAAVGVPFTTAHLAVRRARVTATDTVLVVGTSGNVGAAAVQICRALGCGTVLRASRHAGADVDMAADASLAAARTLTRGRGVDVVINTVGDAGVMKAALGALDLAVRPFYRAELELIGCNTGLQSVEEVADSLGVLAQWFEQGLLVPRVRSEEDAVSLEDVARDYKTGRAGRVVVMS